MGTRGRVSDDASHRLARRRKLRQQRRLPGPRMVLGATALGVADGRCKQRLVEGAMRSQNAAHSGRRGGFAAQAVVHGVGEEIHAHITTR